MQRPMDSYTTHGPADKCSSIKTAIYIDIHRLDVQAALKRGLYFVIIVDSFFLIPASLRQILASLLLHHSARFPRPSARFVLPSAGFLIPDSCLPPPHHRTRRAAARPVLHLFSSLHTIPASRIPASLRQIPTSLR